MSAMSAKEAVRSFVQKELAPSADDGAIADDSNLIDLGIIDSMGVMKLMTFVEETFSITVNPDDLMPENFETLNAIGALLDRYTKA